MDLNVTFKLEGPTVGPPNGPTLNLIFVDQPNINYGRFE